MKRKPRKQTNRRTSYSKGHATKKARRPPLNLSPEEQALHDFFGAPRDMRRFERLQNGLLIDIICRIGYLKKLPYIDSSLYRAGIDALKSDAYLIQWMCEPAPSLGNCRPVELADTEEGRKQVHEALLRISRGVWGGKVPATVSRSKHDKNTFIKDFLPMETCMDAGVSCPVERMVVEWALTPRNIRSCERNAGMKFTWLKPTFATMKRHDLVPTNKSWDSWLQRYCEAKREVLQTYSCLRGAQ